MMNCKRILLPVIALILIGCAGGENVVPVSNDELKAAVAEVVAMKKAADANQAELLSFSEYRNGSKYLARAQRGLEGGHDAEYIQENTNLAKAQLQTALQNTRDRTANAFRILEARNIVLGAGVRSSPDLSDSLDDLDEAIRDETDDFRRSLEPETFSAFQKRYFALEIQAVQFRELNNVKLEIDQAQRDDARKLAPDSLKSAMLDMSEAENLIAQGPRDPKVYQANVELAVDSSSFLTEVLAIIRGAPGTPESIAARVVDQNRKLAKLSQDIDSLQEDLISTQSALTATEGSLQQSEEALRQQDEQLKLKDQALQQQDEQLKLKDEALLQQDLQLQSTMTTLEETESALLLQNQEMEQTSSQVQFQQAVDLAMQELSADEAAIYQQGSNQLIIRLKAIEFKSGSAWLSIPSRQLLDRVNGVLESVGAVAVTVEGHTDSVGADDLNQSLSSERAISVANYLESLAGGYALDHVGHGESRPIASNDTSEGRSLNRRVDLVVTAAQ